MDDRDGAGRGGRLVMLGTPNRGSFAIPLTLSGAEKVLKLLAMGDIDHSLKRAPRDRRARSRGSTRCSPRRSSTSGTTTRSSSTPRAGARLPAKAAAARTRRRRSSATSTRCIDPERLLYVAGVNRETPAKIRIASDGKFSYRETLDGDGRVPHELGLLEGVTTYWVDETHGDLAKNGRGARRDHRAPPDGSHDACSRRRSRRSRSRERRPTTLAVAATPWRRCPPRRGSSPRRRRCAAARRASPHLTPEEEAEARNLTLAEYLGQVRARRRRPRPAATVGGSSSPRRGAGARRGTARRASTIELEVVWGDVTKVDADVYAVGHYEGVHAAARGARARRGGLRASAGSSGVRPAGARDHAARRARQPPRRRSATSRSSPGATRGTRTAPSPSPGMGRPGTFDGVGPPPARRASSWSRSARFRRPRRCAPS